MLTLSPSLSLSYLHIELIQFNFEAAVPHTWADVLLDRSGTWIFLIHHLSRLPLTRRLSPAESLLDMSGPWTLQRADLSDKVATNSEAKYRETLGQDVRLIFIKAHMGMGQNLLVSILMGWTSIYQLFCGSLGTRVMTHSHIILWGYVKIPYMNSAGDLTRKDGDIIWR